MQSYRCHHRPP